MKVDFEPAANPSSEWWDRVPLPSVSTETRMYISFYIQTEIHDVARSFSEFGKNYSVIQAKLSFVIITFPFFDRWHMTGSTR